MKKIISIIVVILSFQISLAQELKTFEDVKEEIIRNHPSVKAVDASVRAIEASAKGAYSWMTPEFGAGFYNTPYNPGKWKGSPAMPGMGMFMISAEQMFPNRKAQYARFHYLKSTAGIEQARENGIINELISKARVAFYDLVINQKKSELIEDNKQLLDFMIKSAEIRYRNNLGNINSYYKLKASLSKLNTDELVLEAERNRQYAAINSLLLRDSDEVFRIDTAFRWFDFSPYLSDDDKLKENSTYLMLDRKILANQLEKQSEQASLKPQFGLKFDHMFAWAHQPQMFSLMAMVRLPIARWSAKEARAKIDGLAYERENYKMQQQVFVSEETGRINVLLAELTGIKMQLAMTEEQILPALEKNFKTLQISYEQSQAEIFELSDAWQSLLDAKLDYLNTLKRGMEIQSELLTTFQIFEK